MRALLSTTEPLVSYHAARLWAIGATAVIAIIAGGFLIPWFNRRRHERLRKKLKLSAAAAEPPPKTDPVTVARFERTKQLAANGVLAIFLGKDGRLSTSTTIAWAWTIVISWILLALLIAWPPSWDAALKNFDGTYIALLGGPYAAWILARVAVSTRVGNSTLQKPQGDGIPRLSDMVSGDDGNPDLFDVQYVTFNLIAMIFVVIAFTHASSTGFPLIPGVLVLLTGGPAAIFAGNKALATNGPLIFTVSPSIVNAKGSFTVYGQNFLAGAAPTGTAGTLRVLVGGQDATVTTTSATDGAVSATAPETGYSDTGPTAVTVITPAGAQALLNGALAVRTAPTLIGADMPAAKVGAFVTLTGSWYPPQDAPLTVIIDGKLAVSSLAGQAPTSTTAQFKVPPVDPNTTLPAQIQVRVMQYSQVSQNSVPLTITK